MKESTAKRLREIIGERTDDEALELLELIDDDGTDEEDWKTKYEENDASWRKRYKERFESSTPPNGDSNVNTPDEDETEEERLSKLSIDSVLY